MGPNAHERDVRSRRSARLGAPDPPDHTAYDRLSDADLVSRAQTDPHAFRLLYERYAEPIHAFAARRCGDHDTALDVTAETFCQAWRSRHTFVDQRNGSAAPWLFGIVRHVLARAARERRLRLDAVVALGLDRRTDESAPSPEAILTDAGLDADLEAALAALPRGQRRAVELRVVGDASYAEVARTLHTTETAARIRVHRGLAGLRTALAESENTP